MARVGFDNTLGYLKGGIASWEKEGKTTDSVEGVEAASLKNLEGKEPLSVFDVRKPGEYLSEHLLDAKSTPLDFINEHMNGVSFKNSILHTLCRRVQKYDRSIYLKK